MKNKINSKKLPIKPFTLPGNFKVEKVDLKKLKPGVTKSFEYKKAVVAYIDILGFSKKENQNEIRATIADFSGPLALTSMDTADLRYHFFSDCAFIVTSEIKLKKLISVLRYAFKQWSSDGILVRGGLALGNYVEYHSIPIESTHSNFKGDLFSGTAINKAVKLENSKTGAFLFIDDNLAEMISKKVKEPIIEFGKHKAIGWSDDIKPLYWYTGISILRLLMLLKSNKKIQTELIEKLANNVKYSLVQEDSGLIFSLVLACIALPSIDSKIKDKTCALIGLESIEKYHKYQELIDMWHNKEDFKFLQSIAKMDSSIPGHTKF